jgi:phosphoribosylglycinamide formyltransferase-1
MIKIAILASGSGSNAQNIIEYFNKNTKIEFSFIITNSENAFVRERAKNLNIPSVYFCNKDLKDENFLYEYLKTRGINWIILAGYLLLIPSKVINYYQNRIINIHPALLPKYGGKGMYGMNVHNTVIANKETESGITIHYVSNNYDEGAIIFQAKCNIHPNDDAEDLANKIHLLEYKHFPAVIEKLLFQ